jgi:hypothetical protein
VQRVTIRDGADRYLLLVIVSFAVTVVGTRWYLQATGYPTVGGGELHIAHMLWGGLLLVVAALIPLLLIHPRVRPITAILAGVGTGLFVDEIGKFITTSNDYFYPAAAPLIYAVLLVLVLVFLLTRREADGPTIRQPAALERAESRWLPHRRARRLLALVLGVLGAGWLLAVPIYLAVGEDAIRVAIQEVTQIPGDPVERPTDPWWYWLEVVILGASGAILVAAAAALAMDRERVGTTLATAGLAVALTAGTIVSLYVEQISAITSTLISAALLLAVLRYRSRFVAVIQAADRPAADRPAAPTVGRTGP